PQAPAGAALARPGEPGARAAAPTRLVAHEALTAPSLGKPALAAPCQLNLALVPTRQQSYASDGQDWNPYDPEHQDVEKHLITLSRYLAIRRFGQLFLPGQRFTRFVGRIHRSLRSGPINSLPPAGHLAAHR